MIEVPGDLGGEMLDHTSRLTTHARRRWDSRAPTGAVNVEDAWALSVEVPSHVCQRITNRQGDTPDRTRVFRGSAAGGKRYHMVFICCDTPNPYADYGSGPTNDGLADEWTNIVTTYRTNSVPSKALRRELEDLADMQEVVG